MPYLRGNTYYLKRKLPGIGERVVKTLDTTRAKRARQIEDMLLDLCERGHLEPVRAWINDEISVHELIDHRDGGNLPELMQEIRQDSVPLHVGFEAMLEHKAPDVKPSTLERYRTGAEHVERIARELRGPDVTVQDVLDEDGEFLQELKAARLDEDAARNTINKDLQALSLLASRAIKKGWIEKRPKVKQYDVPARIRWLEADEIPAYMAALRAPFRPQFQLLIGTGMRLGESEMTRVCDVRFGGDGCRIMLRDSKTTTGVRPVFVPWWIADSLREHIDRHNRRGTDAVFQIQRRTVQAEHNRACGIVGIPDYTVHDHRHTFAVHAARNGMPLDRLQQQLGHVNIEMTMKYARFHPAYNDVGRFFDAMGERWGIGPNPKAQGTNQGTPDKSKDTVHAT